MKSGKLESEKLGATTETNSAHDALLELAGDALAELANVGLMAKHAGLFKRYSEELAKAKGK